MASAALALLLGLSASQLMAQPRPDAGSILRETERALPSQPPRPAPQAAPVRPAIKPTEGVRFVVRAFRFTGVSLIPEADVQAAVAGWLNREIAFADLEQALQAIADLYQSRGWFARPQLPEQDLGDDGSVEINVIEGRLGAIRIDPNGKPPLGDARLLGMLSVGQGTNQPLHLDSLDRAVSLVNDLPGIKITAALSPGEADAQSDIIVKGESRGWGGGSVSLDNTGSRSTGYERLSTGITFDNPARLGDQASVSLMASQGVRYGRLGYTIPVGYEGWRWGVNTSEMGYKLVGAFASTQAEGTSTTYGVTGSYPLIRTSLNNVNFSLSADRKFFFNEAGGRVISEKRLDTYSVGLGGDRSDRLGQGGISLWNISVAGGYVDLSDNADNEAADRRGPASQGNFRKLSINGSRLQRIGERDTLWFSATLQRAPKNLDSSEKFSLGGSQALRAYPSAEAGGDEGLLLTAEHRHSFSPEWQLSSFYDHGWIRVNDYPAFPGSPNLNSYGLRGWGLSMSHTQPGSYALRLTLARRIGINPAAKSDTGTDGDGTLRKVRVWMSAVAYF